MKLIAVTIHLAVGESASSSNFSQNFIISSDAEWMFFTYWGQKLVGLLLYQFNMHFVKFKLGRQ